MGCVATVTSPVSTVVFPWHPNMVRELECRRHGLMLPGRLRTFIVKCDLSQFAFQWSQCLFWYMWEKKRDVGGLCSRVSCAGYSLSGICLNYSTVCISKLAKCLHIKSRPLCSFGGGSRSENFCMLSSQDIKTNVSSWLSVLRGAWKQQHDVVNRNKSKI